MSGYQSQRPLGRWSSFYGWMLRLAAVFCVAGILWGVAVWYRTSSLAAVERTILSTGARLSYDYRYQDEPIALWRRVLYQIPGGKAFGIPFLLDAQGTDFGDQELHVLSSLTEIRYLWLWWSAVTDEGLAGLPLLPDLVSLSVPAGSTENGLVCLRQCPSLESLQLTKSVISDEVVELVVDLPNLQTLRLSSNDMTNEQLQRLRAARPQLEIVF